VDVIASAEASGSDSDRQLLAVLGGEKASWRPLIERWDELRGTLRDLALLARSGDETRVVSRPLAEVALEAPLTDPAARIFAAGGNFAAHVGGAASSIKVADSVRSGKAAGNPPWGFYVIPGTIVGPGAQVRPPRATQKLDYEAEVAAVLAGPVGAPDELRAWGYMAWSDFSIRDAALGLSREDHGPLSWALTKNFATGNACGPWLVVDEPFDVNDLRITCRVNGETRQDDRTSSMSYSFGELAAHISGYLPLGAGDIIASGTPAGTAIEGGLDGPFLRDGDEVEVEVDGAGVLRNRVSFDV
jgi:2-keto-4-pentenoate hydratase/2-oxohepta-3-ene-1,7-dioic acid hydratase in catechol pathway